MGFFQRFSKRVLLALHTINYIMSYSKCAFQGTALLLERKRAAVPGNAEMSRPINARRVMDITFTKGEDVSG